MGTQGHPVRGRLPVALIGMHNRAKAREFLRSRRAKITPERELSSESVQVMSGPGSCSPCRWPNPPVVTRSLPPEQHANPDQNGG
jgi:hypothetical protein